MRKINYSFYLLCFMITVFLSCKEKSNYNSNISFIKKDSPQEYSDDENIIILTKTPKLNHWLNWHKQYDTTFQLENFNATGFSIHMNDLETVQTADTNSLLKKLFNYSPDKKQYIDLYSSTYLRQGNAFVSGEADQVIVLGNNSTNVRKQLMFLGISQVAEFSEWVSNNSFLIGLNSRKEMSDSSQYEIILFNLKENSYTNFVLNHPTPLIKDSFIDFDINNQQLEK